jgi:hypothetical protein
VRDNRVPVLIAHNIGALVVVAASGVSIPLSGIARLNSLGMTMLASHGARGIEAPPRLG